MRPEAEFFIRVLSDHLRERATEPEERLDWGRFFRLAGAHQVAAIAYVQCRPFIPEAYRAAAEKAYGETLFSYSNRMRDMDEIREAFASAGIRFFSVKGLEVARFYPVPALRTMGDCDIVVREEDTERAVARMEEIGFQAGRDAGYVHAWTCDREGRHYELHNDLASEEEFLSVSQRDFFNNYVPYMREDGLDWSFHFLFLLIHLRKHFIKSGVGIRQFMDLAVVLNRGPELKMEWIEEKLRELGLQKFAHACYSLIENWFGIPAPVAHESLPEEKIRTMTEMLLQNGVFGSSNVENQKNGIRNRILYSKYPHWIQRSMILLESLFPGYGLMRNYPGCEYLDGRPVLLPVAWVHRFVIHLRRKGNSTAGSTVKNIMTPEEELKARRELLSVMGL